jgi:hypothetical protein
MTSDPYQQPKKSTSPWVWVGLGCGVMFLGAIAFVGFIVFVVFGSMRASEPYKDAMARAQTDPRVIAVVGSPVRAGYFFKGSINVKNSDGDADMTIPISGPKGEGSLHVTGIKSGGKWTYQEMKVLANGQEINLLEESPDTAPPTS